jgi:hypothetical protein
LLHDIGKAVLNLHVKTYLEAMLVQMSRRGLGFLDAERDTFGLDHQQLGKMIASRWRFPSEVIAGIGYHHHPKEAESHQDVASAVYVANRTAAAVGFGCGLESLVGCYDQEIFGALGIEAETVGQFWTGMTGIVEEIRQLSSDGTLSAAGGAEREEVRSAVRGRR